MSLSPEIRDQAYQFFVEEAQELLQTIELGLLGLRQDSSTAKIHEIMRAAHSLKGGAASVELEAIKTISHRLETIFKALYNDSVILDATLETALLQGYDCLRIPLESQIKTGTLDEVLALEQAEPALSHLENLLKEAIQDSEGYVPSSQDLGIDIVAYIFEVDVAQGLARWQDVLAHPEHCPVAGELRAQLEVFAGLAEILELPGFGELTQTALAAVERHPDRALEVLTLALADFQQAHDQVLRGDRRQGGTPSSALKALAGDISGVGPSDAVLSDAVLSDIVPSDVVSSNFGLTEPRNPVEIPEKSDLNTDLASFPSLESVFGEIGADEGFRSLDDSLGVGMGEQTGEEIGERIGDAIGDGVEERLPLDTGFGEFGPVEVVTDSGSPPSLDAIFGGGAESEVESQPDRGQGSDQDFERDSDKNLGDLPSLESVFGNGADLGDPPSLGAVFGNAVDLDNLSGSKAEDDRPEISDLIDEVTANFDRLPSLAEGATGGTLTTRDLDRSALVG
ncbi:MAG: Hpt domain-containing protein, partial [Prochlorothrix sp.]